MARLTRIVSLLLLALWLPATQHCALEAAGVITKLCHDDGGIADTSCATDGCTALESGDYRGAVHVVQVAPPALHDCLCLICVALTALPPSPSFDDARAALDRPKDWVPTWHFVRRTAPPSRAPTWLSA